ncbi:large conductance mechanosensitive channel [Terrimicrobium sacchariphilum]|jgi:large conductance mechanosensitive channel|uniref:Large-conductance mechanosensitive channel n=1 Tax=Terrimicrobium sacchariphilum TaxID=690879 RepID=A0A146G4F3_TERSA|nr:large-conductance mechanosensitive channel protein MscL [Terrimicrobium sacchariphilum]GAT31666.1 large conductance mechanosensitive channel [Terrimicrobium sacchariphilum]
MAIFQEFRKFIARGNVVDLAVGVIIGAAFGKIVSSLVADIIMPPIGLLLKGVQFTDLLISLNGKTYATLLEAQNEGAPVIAYGSFINACIQFVIVAACVFAIVKVLNTVYKQEQKAAGPTKTETLLEEIRDLLKK